MLPPLLCVTMYVFVCVCVSEQPHAMWAHKKLLHTYVRFKVLASKNVYEQTFWQRFSQSSAICRQLDKAKVFNELCARMCVCVCMCGCTGICNYCRLAQNSLHVLRARHQSSNLAKLLSRIFRSTHMLTLIHTHTRTHTQTTFVWLTMNDKNEF